MSFEVAVVEFPATHLIGMSVRTNMQKAQIDCPVMWQSFGPRIAEIPCCGHAAKGVYGVSVMVDENDFDYWAAVEAAPESAVPDAMAVIDLPSGSYAKCPVAHLQQLSDAYSFLWTHWLQGQKEYVYNEPVPSFELYPVKWRLEDAFEIYMPVRKP